VTIARFRRLALALPEAEPSAHMGHPDFRLRGKVFASLGYPTKEWGMVKLTPDQQEKFICLLPEVFVPAKGAWGLRGATCVNLKIAPASLVRDALAAAWDNTAPKTLAAARSDAAARRSKR
jgi:hypothetical protein